MDLLVANRSGDDLMNEIRVIRSQKDYETMRAELDRLLDQEPLKGSPERDRIEVLYVLLADYEAQEFPPSHVDPVDAILFRVDQLGLSTRDLEPYLGGRSRVSEVLGRKRPLSIAMIRALRDGLGIPAESLINPMEPPQEERRNSEIPWERFPLREMSKRQWIAQPGSSRLGREDARLLLEPFLAAARLQHISQLAVYRRASHVRAGKEMDEFALMAWTARILWRASLARPSRVFQRADFTQEEVRDLVQLSRFKEGPRLAAEWLLDKGISLVVEPHLARTRLDGAAMLSPDGFPVIGLTLRYDRLDNFWFTLLHELGHVVRHVSDERRTADSYYDDLEVEGLGDQVEIEADDFAREALVPSVRWQNSAAAFSPSPDAVIDLANALGVCPAVVAGRVRFERRNYRLLSGLVGAGLVRTHFPEASFDW